MENHAVTKCAEIKKWTAKDGKQVPIYQVEVSDGQIGESFGKEIPVGTPLTELVFEQGQYGVKVKWNKPNTGGGGGFNRGGSRGGNESFALSYAKDIACAHIEKGKEFKAEEVVKVAEVFYVWLQSKKS